MNNQSGTLSLFFGGFGLIFVVFAALDVTYEIMLPSLIFVLFHTILVLVAFPFFLYVMYDPNLSRTYLLTVMVMSIINSVMMFIVSSIDPELSTMFYAAAALELIPLPVIAAKFWKLRHTGTITPQTN